MGFFFVCLFAFYYTKGRNAWTAYSSDFAQYLIIDLGQTMTVTSIVTQGRAESSEYIETFGISYGSNGLDYTEYKESSGNTKVRNNIINHIYLSTQYYY